MATENFLWSLKNLSTSPMINKPVSILKYFGASLLVASVLFFSQCTPSDTGSSDYPRRPITVLVPWAAGGMTDLSSRMMAAVLQKTIDQSVNVINRTGGGGVVGHLAIKSAKPDGYTLGAVTVDITLLHHLGLTDLTYADYTPLALMVNNAAAVTVKADAPWKNLSELIEAIKANPGELQASGTARGGIWDLARMGFLDAAGLPVTAMPWVPSQGAAPALQELLAGGVDVVTASLSEVDALRQAGEVRCLGVMADERLDIFPNVPTLKEQGVDWSIGGWVSVCAPPGLDPQVKAKLDSTLQVALRDPEYTASMEKAGNSVQVITGDALVAFMARQDEVNGKLLEMSSIK